MATTGEINVIALIKRGERWVFLYDDASRAEAIRVMRRFARNPDLSFTRHDAAELSQKVRQEGERLLSERFAR